MKTIGMFTYQINDKEVTEEEFFKNVQNKYEIDGLIVKAFIPAVSSFPADYNSYEIVGKGYTTVRTLPDITAKDICVGWVNNSTYIGEISVKSDSSEKIKEVLEEGFKKCNEGYSTRHKAGNSLKDFQAIKNRMLEIFKEDTNVVIETLNASTQEELENIFKKNWLKTMNNEYLKEKNNEITSEKLFKQSKKDLSDIEREKSYQAQAKKIIEDWEKSDNPVVIKKNIPDIRNATIGIKTHPLGVKHNENKLPMSVLFKQFPRALQAVVLTSCYGHKKYKEFDHNYQNFRNVKGGSQSYFDADIRHQLDKEIYGTDDESGLPHIFHELFDKLAKCELYIQENNIDIKKYSEKYLAELK